MAEFGAKIKLHVDTSGASAFASEIQQMVNSVSDRITLKLKHVDVKFSSSEIQSAIGKIQNQLTNGLKDVKLSVGDISVDQRATSRLKSQMAVFDDVQKKLSSVYRGAISGKSMITDVGQLDNITKRYMAWVETIDKLRTAQTSLSGDRAAKLALEGINIQQSIQGLQQQEKLIESTAKTQERHLTRALNLYKSINAYTKANPKVMNEQFFGSQINSILGTLSSGQDIDDDAYNNAVRQMAVIKNNAREMGIEGQRAGTLIAQAYAKFGGWRMVTGSMQYVVRGFKEMCRSVIEIDTAMTELKKVTDLTDSAYNNFFDRSITRAKDMGATVTDTITATADFARLGYGLNEAEDLADAALIYKNVGDGITDVSSASESIISTMKAFGIEAADSMSIVDKFNEVGNNFAISSKGIGDALQRSASALAAAGNTIDESIGMAVGMNAVIQDPEKVGTVLKTSSMYLRAAKTDAEAAGEATDGMANSVSELRSELLTLTKGKVDIMADDTTFKSTVQIYRELAAVWEDLADIDAANILELIGGKRNATAIASLLTNFDQVEQAITSAGGSEGSALKENETYLDSLKGKLSELKASFEDFSAAIVGSSLLGGIIGIGDGILSFVTILEKLNILLPAVTIGISAFMAKRRAMNFQADTRMVNGILGAIGDPKSIGSIANISDVTKLQMGLLTQKQSEMMLSRVVAMGLPTNLQDDIAQLLGYEVALDSTTNALERYTRAKMRNEAVEDIADADGNGNVGLPKGKFGGLLGGFSKIAIGLSVASMAYSVIKGAYDLYNSHIDGIHQRAADLRTEWEQYSKSYTENIDKIEDYKVEFPKLAAGVDEFGNNVSLTADQFERYRAIVDDIAASSPELIAYYDEQGRAIIKTTGLIEEYEKSQKTSYRTELWNKMSGENFEDLYKDNWHNINSWKKAVHEFNSNASAVTGREDPRSVRMWAKAQNISIEELINNLDAYREKYIDFYGTLGFSPDNKVDEVGGRLFDNYLSNITGAYEEYKKTNKQFVDDMQLVPQLSDDYIKLSDSAKAALSGIIDSLDISKVNSAAMAESVRNQILELTNTFSQLDNLDVESLLAPDTINKAFNDGKVTLEAYNGLMNDVTGTYEATIKSLADTLSLQRNQDLAKAMGIDDTSGDGILDSSEIEVGLRVKFSMDKQDPLKNLNEIINDTKAEIETGYITEPGFINAINSLDLSKSLGSFNISQINELSALFSELNGTRFDNQFDKARTLSVLSGTIDKINEITGDGLNDLLRNLDRSDPDSVERYNEAISGLFDQLRQQPDLAAFGDVFNVLESVLGGAKVAVEDYESQYSNFLTLAETGGMTTGQTALGKAVESLKTGLAEGTVNSKLFNEALSLVFGDTRPKNLENSLSSIEKLFATGEGSAEKMFGELGKYVEDGHVNMKKLRDELNLSDAAFGALKEKIRDMGLSTANKEDINLIGDGLGISNKDVVGFENEASNLVDEYKTGTKTLEEYSNAVDELAQRYGVADDSLDTFRRNMRRMATGRYEISDRESGAIGTMTSFLGIDGDLGNSIEDRISEAQRSLAEGLNSGDKIDYSQVFNTKELMSSIEGDLRSSGEYVESEIQSIMKELESRVSTVRMDTAIEATVSDLKILSDDKPAIEQAIKDAYDTETQTFDIPKLVANIQGIELKQQGDPTKIKNQIFQSLGLVSDGAGGWTAGSDGGLITVKTTAALGSLEAVAGSASSLQEQLNNIAAGTYTVNMPHTQVQSAEGAALSLKYTLQNLTANPWVVNVEYRQTGSPPSSGGSSSTPSVINPPESKPGGSNELYGNAFAGGTIGARRDEVALGGEIGQEIVVDARRGTWRTIGDRGAEFFKVNKGDIIFNAKQTKELLKYGYTNSYGKAYLGGNAYVTTLPGGSYSSNSSSNNSAPTGSKSKDKTPKSSKGSDNDAAKEVAEEFKKVIENIEHEVFLAQKRGASPQELEKLYADMISVSEKYASQLRGMGEDDLTSEHLHEVQKQWWDAWDSITELLEEARDRLKEAINLSSSWRDDAFARGDIEAAQQNTDNIDKYYQESQNSIVEQINRFVGAGFSENNKEVLELKQEWQELEDDRIENNSDMHEAYRDMIEERIDVMSGWRDDAIAKGDIDLIRENTTNMSQAYENAQNDVLKEIEFYRNLGYSDESKEISELLNKHKEYESDRLDIVKEGYEAERSIRENSIALSQKQMSSAIDNGDNARVTELTDNIVNKNKEMQESLHKQAEYYRSLGYAETSEELTELGEQWWEYQEEIDAALEESYTSVVEHTKSMLDSIRNAYDSLKGHAEEYAETGNISVDLITTLSEIGAEYINYLKNEDGQLVINRKSIERLIAAQTEHLAVDSAYAYVMKIKAALEKADTEELSKLTTANYKAAESTWELVYASLELLNLDDDQYKSALRNIHSIRALANQARVDIGKESAEMSQKNEDNKDALEELLDLTMELIKYEKEEEIDALNEQIDKYQEIISLKKESIQESKKESDYNKDIADKLKDISELQSRIDRLSLDDSREAQAEKKSLEEELSDLQKDFADFQADYSVDKQTEALDKELEAFEDEKKEEIEIIEESISSTEKLYQLALKRIEDDWDTLVSDIIKWNYDAGNSVEDDIVDKLQLAIDKVKEFSGSYKDAMQSIEDYEEEDHDIIGDYHDYGDPAPIKAQMKANSLEYFISSEDKQDNLSRLNRQLATQLEKIYGKNIIPINGSWYVEGSEDPIYTLEVYEIIDYITDAMYKNAQALHTASEDMRSELAIANERMATYIEEVSQHKIRKDGDDVWWIDDVKLFESYGSITPRPEVHHNGGVVGESRSAKDNEVLTLLENGEMVLNNSKKESLYDYMDIATYMMNKFGAVIEGITSSSSFVPHLLSDGLEKLISGSSSTALSNIANANQNVTIENVEVIAPIQVVQKLDESDIKEHSRTIGELSSRYIRESLSRKGIVPAISSI